MTGQFRLMRMARPAERDYVHWEEAALSLRRPYITLISGGVESAIGTAPIDLRVARKLRLKNQPAKNASRLKRTSARPKSLESCPSFHCAGSSKHAVKSILSWSLAPP